MSITAMLCSVMNTYLLCAQGTLYHCRRLFSNFLFSLWSGCRVAVTRMENMDFCKRMMIQRPTRLCSAPILLVSLDLWILAQVPTLLAKSVNSSEICLPHITSLCMQIGTLDAVKRSIQCKASSAGRRNYLAIQIGGFLRRFAQRSVETSGRFWSNPGRRVFLARKSSGHGTVNLCGSSILVKDRDKHICDLDKLDLQTYVMV